MLPKFEIRYACVADAAEVASLIDTTLDKCCFTAECPYPPWLKTELTPEAMARLLQTPSMICVLAIQDAQVVGVLAIHDRSRIKYFFVDANKQGQGIGKQLWIFAQEAGAFADVLTVRSSLNAVPIYAQLGFMLKGEVACFNGLYYQEMLATGCLHRQ